MSVLLKSATLEDIAAITETPNPRVLLDTLVKRSLVRMREDNYSLLPIVRDYAQDKLTTTSQDPRELHTRAVNHYRQINTLEGAITATDHLFELATRFRLQNAAEAFAEYMWGFYYDLVTRGYWAEARSKTEQFIAVARTLDDKQGEARAIGELGSRYQDIGEYERAIELHQKAQSLLDEIGDKYGVATALHQRGIIAMTQGDYSEAAKLFRQSLDI